MVDDPSKRKERNKRYYQRRKQQLKEQSDAEISEHLEKFPLDLHYKMKEVKSKSPSFAEMQENDPNLSWEEYSELIEDIKDSEPRELTPEEMQPFLKATSGDCQRCGGEIEIGYEGSKLCLKCKLEMS